MTSRDVDPVEVPNVPKVEELPEMVQALHAKYKTGITAHLSSRRLQLRQLIALLHDHCDELVEAMHMDFKARYESRIEVHRCMGDAMQTLDHLEVWTEPEYVDSPYVFITDACKIVHEPKGVVLIIGTWNYPLELVLLPWIGAVAAGNCVVIKFCEVVTHTATLLQQLWPQYIDSTLHPFVNGGVPTVTKLLQDCVFDHIFYTGNGKVGRVIATAAAKNLTPCTLELGGKSPVYVSDDSDMQVAASRILAGKYYNAGQTCIAPDYVLTSSRALPGLVQALKSQLAKAYPEKTNPMNETDQYSRISNTFHANRIRGLLQTMDGEIVHGGLQTAKDRYIPLTIVQNVSVSQPVMQDEIFGPILPLVLVENVQEAINFINSRSKPLILYIFAKKRQDIDRLINETSSGSVLVNDTMYNMIVDGLPFGGVGESGYGAYHGKHSFLLFSHAKSVMHRSQGLEFLNKLFRYPPVRHLSMTLWVVGVAKVPLKYRTATGDAIRPLWMTYLWLGFDRLLRWLLALILFVPRRLTGVV